MLIDQHMKKLLYFKNQDQEWNNKRIYPDSYRHLSYLPMAPSQSAKNDPSLLRDRPLGNWRFLRITLVSFVLGLYFRTLPLSSAEKTSCMKFLKQVQFKNLSTFTEKGCNHIAVRLEICLRKKAWNK